jgi:tetratricopeptide (TPR) repeat protein
MNQTLALPQSKRQILVMSGNRFSLGLLVVFFVAFLSRSLFLKWGYVPELVYFKYLYLARDLFSAEWWQGTVFLSSPGYQFFIALWDRLFQLNHEGIRQIQVILGALVCVILSLLGRRIDGPATGITAGLLAALYQPFILYDVILATTTLDLLCNVLGVFFLYRACDSRRFSDFFLMGLTLGIGIITRPTTFLLILAGLPVALVLVRSKYPGSLGFQQVLIGVFGLLLPIIPVTLLNWAVGHEFVLVTASSGNLLYSGNSYYANGLTYSPPESMLFLQNHYAIRSDSTLPVEHLMFVESAREATGKKLTAAESNKFWQREAWKYMKHYPARTIDLFLHKAFYFWNAYANHDTGEAQINQQRIEHWPFLPIRLIVPLGLAGLVILVFSGSWIKWIWIILPILTYWISTTMVFNVDRYRLPAFPFLILLAAGALTTIYSEVKRRQFGKPVFFVVLTILLSFVVTYETEAIRFTRIVEAPLFELEQRAVKAMRQFNLTEAKRLFQEMVSRDPGSAQLAHENLAIIARMLGDKASAERESRLAAGLGIPTRERSDYQTKIDQNPQDHEAIIALGCLDWSAGNQAMALLHFRQAVAVAPWWPNAHFNLGVALLYSSPSNPRGAIDELTTAFESGLKFAPQAHDILYHLGVAHAALNMTDQAIADLREAIRRDAQDNRAHELLRQLLKSE